MTELLSVPLIHALTRPPTVFGLTYKYFGLMLVFCLMFLFITKWYVFSLILTVTLYLTGRWLTAYDPQWMDGYILLRQRIRHQKNAAYWGCRSYAPW